MRIENDLVEFEASDVAEFSAEVQAAIADYNAGISAEVAVSGVINSFVALARSVAIARSVDVVKTALVGADAADRAAANAKLDEAKIILGVQFLLEEETTIAVK